MNNFPVSNAPKSPIYAGDLLSCFGAYRCAASTFRVIVRWSLLRCFLLLAAFNEFEQLVNAAGVKAHNVPRISSRSGFGCLPNLRLRLRLTKCHTGGDSDSSPQSS